MAKVIFVTGGQRSGKSSFAQAYVERQTKQPIYLATAHIWDEDFRDRVRRHQEDRGTMWRTIEEERKIASCPISGEVVLLDCITLWLTNLFFDNEYQVEPTLRMAKEEWEKFIALEGTFVVVSNEIGMGVHGVEASARHFADLQGWMNQFIAQKADEVYLMVSGIPLRIK